MSTFVPSPTKRARHSLSAADELDPAEYRQLMAQGRKLLETVQDADVKQNVWKEELKQCYKVEKQRKSTHNDKRASRGSRATNGQDDDDDVKSMTNPGFSKWLTKQNNAVSVTHNDLGSWFHLENLAIKTPFAAVVPCGGRATRLMEAAMNGFGFPAFFVQTVPISAPIADVSRAFVPCPAHIPVEQRAATDDLGPFGYVGAPCANGGDAIHLIDQNAGLQEALARTQVLLLNDYLPRVPICMRILVVAGKCVAAEVACDEAYTPLFGVVPNDGEGSRRAAHERRRAQTNGHRSADEDPVVETATDVLAFGVASFVTDGLGEMLGSRSYEAIVLAEVKGFDPRLLGPGPASPPFWPHFGTEPLDRRQSPFAETGLRFYLLNIDEPSTHHFQIFTPAELRVISGYIHRKQGSAGDGLPPVLRFLDGHTEKLDDGDDETMSTVTVSTNLREAEKAAERRRERARRGQGKHRGSDDRPRRRSRDAEPDRHAPRKDTDHAPRENGEPHDQRSHHRRDPSHHKRDPDAGRPRVNGDSQAARQDKEPRRPSAEERHHSSATSETGSTASSSRLPSRLSSFSETSSGAPHHKRHADPSTASQSQSQSQSQSESRHAGSSKSAGNSAPRHRESIYTEERPHYLQPDQGRRPLRDTDVESSRSSRLPDRQPSVRGGSQAGADAFETQSTRSSLPPRRASQLGGSMSAGPAATSTARTSLASASKRDAAASSVTSSNLPRVPRVEAAAPKPIEQEKPDEGHYAKSTTSHASSVRSSQIPESEKPEIERDPNDEKEEALLRNGSASWPSASSARRPTVTPTYSSHHTPPASSSHRPRSEASEPVTADRDSHTEASNSAYGGRDDDAGSSVSNNNVRSDKKSSTKPSAAPRSSHHSSKVPSTTGIDGSSNAPQTPLLAKTPSGTMSEGHSSRYTPKSGHLSQQSHRPSSQAASSRRGDPLHERFENGSNNAPQTPLLAKTPSGTMSEGHSSRYTPKSGHLSEQSHRPSSQAASSYRGGPAHERFESGSNAQPLKDWSPSTSRMTSNQSTPAASDLPRQQQLARADAQSSREPANSVGPDQSPVPVATSVGQSTWMSPNSSAFRSAQSSQYTTPASRALPSEMLHSLPAHSATPTATSARDPNEESPLPEDAAREELAESSTATGSLYNGLAPDGSHREEEQHGTDDDVVSPEHRRDSETEEDYEGREGARGPAPDDGDHSTQPGESVAVDIDQDETHSEAGEDGEDHPNGVDAASAHTTEGEELEESDGEDEGEEQEKSEEGPGNVIPFVDVASSVSPSARENDWAPSEYLISCHEAEEADEGNAGDATPNRSASEGSVVEDEEEEVEADQDEVEPSEGIDAVSSEPGRPEEDLLAYNESHASSSPSRSPSQSSRAFPHEYADAEDQSHGEHRVEESVDGEEEGSSAANARDDAIASPPQNIGTSPVERDVKDAAAGSEVQPTADAATTTATAPAAAAGGGNDDLRKARLMAMAAVVTANAALETILKASKKAEGQD